MNKIEEKTKSIFNPIHESQLEEEIYSLFKWINT